jgi:hypothetical protein
VTASPSDVLSEYARHLRAAAPKEWEAFVHCFDAYATEVTVAVIHADQSSVLNAQGRASAFLHLLKLFQECGNPPKKSPQPTTAPSV